MMFNVTFTGSNDVLGCRAHTSTLAEQVGDDNDAGARLTGQTGPAETPRSVREFARSVPVHGHQGSVVYVVVYVLTDMSGQRVWLGHGRFGPCAERESLGEARCFPTARKANRAVARLRSRDWFLRVAPLCVRVFCASSENSTLQ